MINVVNCHRNKLLIIMDVIIVRCINEVKEKVNILRRRLV